MTGRILPPPYAAVVFRSRIVIPVDFPVDKLSALLTDVRTEHQKAPIRMVQETRRDEGIDVTLSGYRAGPMYLQFMVSIRNDKGDLGVPFEAELSTQDGVRLPLYRAEMPWWHDEDGVATLLAPLPPRAAALTLKIRQVRLFSTGPGSRALKVRAFAPTPLQPPPVRLSPGDEERYRALGRGAKPVEPCKDVYGYWDFDFQGPDPSASAAVPCNAVFPVLDQAITIHGRGPRALYARMPLDWKAAYAAPPVWDGLTTVHLEGGLVGVGSVAPQGDVAWLFPEDLPEAVHLEQVILYRIPVNPPLDASGKFLVRPFPGELAYELMVRRLTVEPVSLRSVAGNRLTQTFLMGFVHVHTDRDDAWFRPYMRFWTKPDKSDRYEAPTWTTPRGEYFHPVSDKRETPSHWDATAVNVLVPLSVDVTTPPDAEAVTAPPPFIPPSIYATHPLELML